MEGYQLPPFLEACLEGSPMQLAGLSCAGCGADVPVGAKALICSDCGAVFCEECVRTGVFEAHECKDGD